MASLTLTDLYVLASRVQRGDRLYVIGFDPRADSDHLRKLKHTAALAIWRHGYEPASNRWEAPRAARVAAQMASKGKAAAAKHPAATEPPAKRARPSAAATQPTAKRAAPAATPATHRSGTLPLPKRARHASASTSCTARAATTAGAPNV